MPDSASFIRCIDRSPSIAMAHTCFQGAAALPTPASSRAVCTCGSRRPASRRLRACAEPDEAADNGRLSRRVFNAGVLASGIGTAWVGSRIVIGDDLKSKFAKRLRQRFPSLFPPVSSPEDRRLPADADFCERYFETAASLAAAQGLVSKRELAEREVAVRATAFPLFFDDDALPVKELSNAGWLNFVLYARLRAAGEGTSPLARKQLTQAMAERTRSQVPVPRRAQQNAEWAQSHAELWLADIQTLLQALKSIGWISGFRVEEFDETAWREEGRASLTVYAFDPLPLQAAQLLGEEEMDEIGPKVSPWIEMALRDAGVKGVSREDYYLDDAYRPDPADFRPSQLATEFDLSVD